VSENGEKKARLLLTRLFFFAKIVTLQKK